MFEYSYLNHYYDLKRFKMFFIEKCPVTPKYEAYKIWAAWIIEQRSFYQSIDFFLPNITQKKFINQADKPVVQPVVQSGFQPVVQSLAPSPEQLIQVLIEKGTDNALIERFYTDISTEAQQLTKAHLYLKLKYNPQIEVVPVLQHHRQIVSLSYQSIKHVLKQSQYYKLSTYYRGPKDEFHLRLWKMLNNYYLLDGHSYQWAIPNRILKTIRLYMNVKAELFASPINSHYPEYYSLFSEDGDFGSRGNFFRAPDEDFLEGVFQVNPPFIDRIFLETIKKILHWLDLAEINNRGLMFIFFMPGWLDSAAYRLAKEDALVFQEIRLAENQHYYYSYHEHRYVKVQFATHILILSNSIAQNWFTPNIRSNIINIFSNPFT